MRCLGLVSALVFVALSPACGEGSNSDSACDRLADRCPYCTLPGLRATCENAVASNDPASCQDGLDDPDVQSNCVPPGGADAPSGGGGAVCGNPNECICPAATTCDYDCLAALPCELSCMPGSQCTAPCDPSATCNIECASSTSCDVDCRGGDCDVTCPTTGCTVTNCPEATCQVTCGVSGQPTRTGNTATCP